MSEDNDLGLLTDLTCGTPVRIRHSNSPEVWHEGAFVRQYCRHVQFRDSKVEVRVGVFTWRGPETLDPGQREVCEVHALLGEGFEIKPYQGRGFEVVYTASFFRKGFSQRELQDLEGSVDDTALQRARQRYEENNRVLDEASL